MYTGIKPSRWHTSTAVRRYAANAPDAPPMKTRRVRSHSATTAAYDGLALGTSGQLTLPDQLAQLGQE
jgi:hypothetical protein